MIAFKFLARGAVSPFTGFRWPAAGEWVSAPAERGAGAWVHACRPRDLPHWLDEELWRMELGEPVQERAYQLAAPRARLVERVGAWDPRLAREYAAACALRAREIALPHLEPALRDALAHATDLDSIAAAARSAPAASPAAALVADAAHTARHGGPATASYVAAALASSLGAGLAGFEAERAWQARWLADRLGLEPATRG